MASTVRGLCESSAGELAELIRRREVSSRDVVTAHLERIEGLNGELGAVTRVLREEALAAADRCDRSEPRGPLHGVPFSVKENLDCLGSATTHGLPALRGALPYADAPTVERLKGAGAIPIARTNLSELGLRLCTVNSLHGRTLNPYDRRLTAGGSSGGDAVAVATGMVPLGLGNDLGGSLRVGGAWRFVNQHPQGEAMFYGEYREIARPGRLVFTEIFAQYPDSPSLVSATFTSEGDKTRLTATVRYPSRQVRDLVLGSGMTRGAAVSYDRLEDVLAELQKQKDLQKK